ncbi:hypothetical protein, partial [Corynebacterium parakroppenstedtii]|uniref:hypothetical protein n=1 Tax=Corynebacterium parakroppenstedtii TaxID=2828363 RepID=UPI001F26D1E6
ATLFPYPTLVRGVGDAPPVRGGERMPLQQQRTIKTRRDDGKPFLLRRRAAFVSFAAVAAAFAQRR